MIDRRIVDPLAAASIAMESSLNSGPLTRKLTRKIKRNSAYAMMNHENNINI
jgi:hypothetical protein